MACGYVEKPKSVGRGLWILCAWFVETGAARIRPTRFAHRISTGTPSIRHGGGFRLWKTRGKRRSEGGTVAAATLSEITDHVTDPHRPALRR